MIDDLKNVSTTDTTNVMNFTVYWILPRKVKFRENLNFEEPFIQPPIYSPFLKKLLNIENCCLHYLSKNVNSDRDNCSNILDYIIFKTHINM